MARQEADLRSSATRLALLDAGIAAFLGGGFAGTSVGDIVQRAGVPKGSFYYYFDSKSALACAAVARYAQFDQDARERLHDGTAGPLARLRAYFADHAAAFAKAGCDSGCLLGILGLELAVNDADVAAQVQSEMERWAAALGATIEAAKAAGEIAATQPALTLARALICSWEGALIRMRLERDGAALRAFQAIVFDALLQPV
jgi:TetR/AcrR family transcriptional repressor of nem operon